MPYSTLASGRDYLQAYATLNSQWRLESESIADLWVDSEFTDYDRSLWAGENVPPDVRRIAGLIGSAEYILREFAKSNPAMEDVPLARTLWAQAKEKTRDIQQKGYVLANDRTRQYPESSNASGMNLRVVR